MTTFAYCVALVSGIYLFGSVLPLAMQGCAGREATMTPPPPALLSSYSYPCRRLPDLLHSLSFLHFLCNDSLLPWTAHLSDYCSVQHSWLRCNDAGLHDLHRSRA